MSLVLGRAGAGRRARLRAGCELLLVVEEALVVGELLLGRISGCREDDGRGVAALHLAREHASPVDAGLEAPELRMLLRYPPLDATKYLLDGVIELQQRVDELLVGVGGPQLEPRQAELDDRLGHRASSADCWQWSARLATPAAAPARELRNSGHSELRRFGFVR